jgi:hypothetical protein
MVYECRGGVTYGIFGLDERIVDGNNLDIGMLNSIAEDDTANTAKSVDTDLDSHFANLRGI